MTEYKKETNKKQTKKPQAKEGEVHDTPSEGQAHTCNLFYSKNKKELVFRTFFWYAKSKWRNMIQKKYPTTRADGQQVQ